MPDDPPPRRSTVIWTILALLCLFITNIVLLNSDIARSALYAEWLPLIPGASEQRVGRHIWRKSREPTALREVEDVHPIRNLIHNADESFGQYDADRSRTFRNTVIKYRRKYGRHPPPGFKQVRTHRAIWHRWAVSQ